MKIEKGCRVKIDYTLSTEEDVIDSTEGVGPLEFVVGEGRLHPAIEKLILGLESGQNFDFDLDPSLAFGERKAELEITMARAKLPGHLAGLDVGTELELKDHDGKLRAFRVVQLDETKITLDGNSPLAGQLLHVEGRVLAVDSP